jgi:hypothetical protein
MLSAYLLVVHKPARVDPPLIPIKRARMYREALPALMQLQASALVRSERPSAITIICTRIRRFDNVREEPRAQDGLQQLGVVRVAVRALSRLVALRVGKGLQVGQHAEAHQIVPKLAGHVAHALQRTLREEVPLAEAIPGALPILFDLLFPSLMRLEHGQMIRLMDVKRALNGSRLITLVHR